MHLYRYVDSAERADIEATHRIASLSGTTWYALVPPSLYFSRADARRLLAIPAEKTYRFGPILEAQAPPMDAVPPRTSPVQQLKNGSWVAGGGTECATTDPCWLQGFSVLGE
jgi:hypothetical protein